MILFWLKLRTSFRSVKTICTKPAYISLALITAFLFMQLILWSTNFSLARYIVFTDAISAPDKLSFFASSTFDVFTSISRLSNVLLVLVSLLQGVVIASLVYVIRFNRSVDTKIVGGSVFATVLATIGLGCVACGTSLLVPIVAIFASSSAAVITKSLTTPVMILSIFVAMFSLYKVGLQAASVLAQEPNDESVDIAIN